MSSSDPNVVKDEIRNGFNSSIQSALESHPLKEKFEELFEAIYTQLTEEFTQHTLETFSHLTSEQRVQLGRNISRSLVSAINNIYSENKGNQPIIDFALYSLRTDLSNTLNMIGEKGEISTDRFISDVSEKVKKFPAINNVDLGFGLMTHVNYYLATHDIPDEKIETYYQSFVNGYSGMLKVFQNQELPFKDKNKGIDKLVLQSMAQAMSILANDPAFQDLSPEKQIELGEKIANELIEKSKVAFKKNIDSKKAFPNQDTNAREAYAIITTMNDLLISSGKKLLEKRSSPVVFTKKIDSSPSPPTPPRKNTPPKLG